MPKNQVVPKEWVTHKTKIPKGTMPSSFKMTAAQLRERAAEDWSERTFQEHVIDAARRCGFILIYHTHDSRRSQPGFPDLVLVNPRTKRVLFRELKSAKGKISKEQQQWADGLRKAGADFDFWYPKDWVSERIHNDLRGASDA